MKHCRTGIFKLLNDISTATIEQAAPSETPAAAPRKRGRPAGSKNKTMVQKAAERPIPRVNSAEAKQTNQALSTLVAKHFQTQASAHKYLDKLAKDHVSVYVGLVSKVIPQAVAIDITTHAVDLGAAMVAATERLQAYRAGDELPVIDLAVSEVIEVESGGKVVKTEAGGVAGGTPAPLAGAGAGGPDPDTLKIFSRKRVRNTRKPQSE